MPQAERYTCPEIERFDLWVRLDLDPRESASLRRLNPRSYQMLIADRIREDPGDLSGLSQLNPERFVLAIG